jgi:cytochrome oxidase Cu insertion factor (SCO1/SenC/PrrC family)
MRRSIVLAAVVLAAVAGTAAGQAGREDPEFVKKTPTLGDPFPGLTVYTPDGKEFDTASLRGHYSVIAFGCLT